MSNKKLHIVSLDVPFPPDYGAMIDTYFRCKALKKAGVSITLHTYEYGRGKPVELEEIADKVIYYKRPKKLSDLFSRNPFIVETRKSQALLENLLKDNDPVFFEGQHTCYFIHHESLKSRRKFVRIHNIEWQYYYLLAERTNNLARKLFFRLEAKKLKRFDAQMKYAEALFCVSHQDLEHYSKLHPKVILMPSSSPFTIPEQSVEREQYAIYHANLSVEENEEAALWIIEAFEEFGSPLPLVITGKNPSEKLEQAAAKSFCKLIANPGQPEMSDLILKAGVQLLITFQNTGIKLKLINSLVSGGACIANEEMTGGTDLGQFCTMIDSKKSLIEALNNVSDLYPDTTERIAFLKQNYDPDETCKRVLEVL